MLTNAVRYSRPYVCMENRLCEERIEKKKLVETTTQKIYVATAEYFIWVRFGLVLFRFSYFVNCVLFSDTTKKMLNTERSSDTYFLNKHIFDWFFNLDFNIDTLAQKKHNNCLHCADVLSEIKKKWMRNL